MSALSAFTFAIGSHNLTIVEADGEDIAPYTVRFSASMFKGLSRFSSEIKVPKGTMILLLQLRPLGNLSESTALQKR